MSRTTTRMLALVAAGGLATFPLVPAHAAGGSSKGNSNGKQTICHATNSNTNPYVVITPNKDGDVDGHAKHTGPVWTPTLKAQHISWGDIIPPFDYNDHGTPAHYPGMNWSVAGQAIFANGCRPVVTATVVKTNDADRDGTFTHDETATSAGAPVAFRVVVTNTSGVSARLASITDVSRGSTVPFTCDPQVVGSALAPGASAMCLVTVPGYSPADGAVRTNTVTAVLQEVGHPGNTGTASDTSTVRTAVPVTAGGGAVTPSPTSSPTSSPATGGGGGVTTGSSTGPSTGPSAGLTTAPTGTFTGGGGGAVTAPTTARTRTRTATFTGGGGGAVTAAPTGARSSSVTGGGGAVTAVPSSSARGAGGGLPFTGFPMRTWLTAALALVLAGAGSLLAARRPAAV